MDEKTVVNIEHEKVPKNVFDEDKHEKLKKVQKCLTVKDAGLISDASYHELHMVPGTNLPLLGQIKEERKNQNQIIDVKPLDKVSDILRKWSFFVLYQCHQSYNIDFTIISLKLFY